MKTRLTQGLSLSGGRLSGVVSRDLLRATHAFPVGHRCTVVVLAGTHRCATESRVTLWQSAIPSWCGCWCCWSRHVVWSLRSRFTQMCNCEYLHVSLCSRRLSPSTLNRRSAYCGILASAFRRDGPLPCADWNQLRVELKVHLFATVSWCLRFEHRFVDFLENTYVGPSSVALAECFQLRAGTPLWSKL